MLNATLIICPTSIENWGGEISTEYFYEIKTVFQFEKAKLVRVP
jgi:hypothetical protein